MYFICFKTWCKCKLILNIICHRQKDRQTDKFFDNIYRCVGIFFQVKFATSLLVSLAGRLWVAWLGLSFGWSLSGVQQSHKWDGMDFGQGRAWFISLRDHGYPTRSTVTIWIPSKTSFWMVTVCICLVWKSTSGSFFKTLNCAVASNIG